MRSSEKPFISSLGNALVQKALQCLSGKPLTDTQTGLRAFDKSLLDLHLKTPGKKFEYETNALMVCIRKNIAIAETPITTIYHDRNNSCSHFRRIKDSVRIGMGIALFASSSFLCFLIDYFLYALGVTLLPPGTYSLVLAIAFARIASSAVNYFLNYTFVFSSDRPHLQTAPAYFALVTFIMICNCAITVSLTHLAGINPFIAKIIAECSLFILSFTIQHLKIFFTPHNKKVNLS